MNDWPSWTIDEKNHDRMEMEPTIKTESNTSQQQAPNVGIVNQEEIEKAKQNQKLQTKIKVPLKRYGRGAIRMKRLQAQK